MKVSSLMHVLLHVRCFLCMIASLDHHHAVVAQSQVEARVVVGNEGETVVLSSSSSSSAAAELHHPELQIVQLEVESLLLQVKLVEEEEVEDLLRSVLDLKTQYESLMEQEDVLVVRTKALERSLYSKSTTEIAKLIKIINNTIHDEFKARNDHNDATVETAKAMMQDAGISGVTFQQMEKALNGNQMLYDGKGALHNWVRSVVEQMVDMMDWTPTNPNNTMNDTATAMSSISKTSTTTPTCTTPSQAAQWVQQAILEKTTHPLDYLQSATVVHELTSHTYIPPPTLQDRMGHVWWRRFIPDDIERWILPHGWQDWNVGMASLSSPLFRLLNLDGSATSDTLPPEAILDSNTYPGACWPMRGSTGHVTLRLAQPVIYDAITITHAHASLLINHESRPRFFTITGYPPCHNAASSSCPWGFDTSNGTVMSVFEFDTSQASQTFERKIPTTTSSSSSSSVDEPTEGGSSSCSAVKPSCGTETAPLMMPNNDGGNRGYGKNNNNNKDMVVAGIRIEITGNWGNPDYTCLYRAQLHGSQP